jgi:hypothetical protein
VAAVNRLGDRCRFGGGGIFSVAIVRPSSLSPTNRAGLFSSAR